jgi:heat-inducible transcriptional repressor
VTTETLSQVTNLLAIVHGAADRHHDPIRHVEVLALQPQVLMVVIITSTGGVVEAGSRSSRRFDPGLAEWAAAYLNEQLVGMGPRRADAPRRLRTRRCRRPSARSSAQLAPAFTELAETRRDTLYVDGAAAAAGPSTASRTSRSSTR